MVVMDERVSLDHVVLQAEMEGMDWRDLKDPPDQSQIQAHRGLEGLLAPRDPPAQQERLANRDQEENVV